MAADVAAHVAVVAIEGGTMQAHFVGKVITQWLPDGREMQLCEPFEFVAANGQRWRAPAGVIVDGASIPRFFWRFIGSPFCGRYRRASVLHDVYCQHHNDETTSAMVHQMFFEAMRCDGCPAVLSLLMWLAVRVFGPSF